MPWRVDPDRDGLRPIEEQAVERCTVTTVQRCGKSWINRALSVGKWFCADLRAQCCIDQVQELLLRGQVQGPHIETPLARWSIRQICFAPNVDHVETDLVFEKPGDEFLDLGH